MSKFKDFESFVSPLQLPYRGKTYELPLIGAKTGARLHMILAQNAEYERILNENAEAVEAAKKAKRKAPKLQELPEVPENPTNQEMLGEAIDELYDDDLPIGVINVMANTVYYDFILGREAAEVYWNSGGDPKELQSYINQLTNSSMNGAGANTTKRPASTSGTKSKTKNSRSTTAAPRKSDTAKSSKNGDS